MCFSPLPFSALLWLSCIFSQTGLKRPISAQWPWLVISEAQSPLLSNTAAFVLLTGKLKAHTFSFQKILSNLVKNIFCPAKPLFLILRFTFNFKIICAQSESLICHSYAHCGSNFAQLICCSSSITIPNQQWVSDLIYTLDPWPSTESDRFQSTKKHVSMPCPPPSHISTAQYSFLKLYAPTPTYFQTLNPSFLVHMASRMVLWWIELPSNQP